MQRPTANGLETVEKQSQVVSKQGKNYQAESTTYRSDGNGGFYSRRAPDHRAYGAGLGDFRKRAEYERGANGELQSTARQ